MTFDPEQLRRTLFEFAIESARKEQFAEAFKMNALEGCGWGILTCCLECCLVGLFDTARELFPKSRAFLRAAIEHNEIPRYYFPAGTESLRLKEFAQCEWFIAKRHDAKALKEAVKWKETDLSGRAHPDKTSVQWSLATYLDAEEYAVLVERFEHTGLKSPKNLRQIKGEGTMSYVIARHRLGLEYTPQQVQAALESFLKRNVPVWVGGSHYETTAQWMKIAFWKPDDDPIATFLRCYDYLPGVAAPSYP